MEHLHTCIKPDLSGWFPASVVLSPSGPSLVSSGGPQWVPCDQESLPFWDYVAAQGGTWMWKYVEGDTPSMKWLAMALQNGTAIAVTDGSYNRSLAPDISGAGWLIACTESQKMLGGWFYEHSRKAGSYRGELLGSVATHLLAAFTAEYFSIDICRGDMACNNKGALNQAAKLHQRVRTSAKHSDLLRTLRTIKSKCPMSFCYKHVRGHQDKHLSWRSLSLIEQFNVQCDTLAGQAVTYGAVDGGPAARTIDLLLPRERAAVVVDGHKLMSDVSDELRHFLGREDARRFFTAPIRLRRDVNVGGLGWSRSKFDSVDWAALRAGLSGKSEMYGVWLAKQTIGICATRRNMARITGSDDDRCPNCLCGPERSNHLLRCSDPGRTALFDEDVNDLYDWMMEHGRTDEEAAYWLHKYLLLRGEVNMLHLGEMSDRMKRVAAAVDEIGWVDFMHGRLPTALHALQQEHCRLEGRISGADWMKLFVRKIINITHGQWLYRNFSLHNSSKGFLHLKRQEEVLSWITHLAECDPRDIPEDSQFLLEIEIDAPETSLVQKEYWVAAVQAALTAGWRRKQHKGTGSWRMSSRSSGTKAQRLHLHRVKRRSSIILRQIREELELHPGSGRQKRQHGNFSDRTSGSNKRLRKPD